MVTSFCETVTWAFVGRLSSGSEELKSQSSSISAPLDGFGALASGALLEDAGL